MKTIIKISTIALLTLVGLNQAKPALAQTATVSKDVEVLLGELADIDRLRVINPLKLSATQLDKILTVIKNQRDEFNKKVPEVAVNPIKSMSDEIKAVRAKMLKGEMIPEDFDKKVKKIQEQYYTKRKAQDQADLKLLSDTIKPILTKEQFDKAVSIVKKLTTKEGEPSLRGTDDQFLNFYIKGTFMDYSSAISLIEAIKSSTQTLLLSSNSATRPKK